MLMREEQQRKTELVDQVAERAAAGAGGRGDEVRLFSLQFYEHVSPDDVLGNVLGGRPDELIGAVLSLWELGQQRTPGVPKIRLSRPDPQGHTVIEIVNDDMPFLVDSVGRRAAPPECRHPAGDPSHRPRPARRGRAAGRAAARPARPRAARA